MLRLSQIFVFFIAITSHALGSENDTTLSSFSEFWLEPETGQESLDGYQILSVEEQEQGVKIELQLPELAGEDSADGELNIEEVTVYGKAPENISSPAIELEQIKPFEVVLDSTSGRHGVILYLGDKQPIRVNINYYDGYRFH